MRYVKRKFPRKESFPPQASSHHKFRSRSPCSDFPTLEPWCSRRRTKRAAWAASRFLRAGHQTALSGLRWTLRALPGEPSRSGAQHSRSQKPFGRRGRRAQGTWVAGLRRGHQCHPSILPWPRAKVVQGLPSRAPYPRDQSYRESDSSLDHRSGTFDGPTLRVRHRSLR